MNALRIANFQLPISDCCKSLLKIDEGTIGNRKLKIGNVIMETFIKDIRFAVRGLLKRRGFTSIAVLTLALGIGACTAIFSVVDGVLLRSLPYPEAERLVELQEVTAKGSRISFAEPNFLDLRARSHTLEGVAEYSGGTATVIGGSEPARAVTVRVSADFFRVIGTRPFLGRTFAPEESKPGGAPVAVISNDFWRQVLGGKTDLTATTLRISDKSFSVIGVMPPGFGFPYRAGVWIPREISGPEISRSAHNWHVVARMLPAIKIEQARAEVSTIGKQLKQEHGKDMDAVDFALTPQQEYLVGNVRGALMMIFVAVGFLLAVACANVANLLLAQVTARQREFAVRSALGATRLHLARQFITENLLMTLTAGALGVLLSFWGVELLIRLNQQSLPRVNEIGVNLRVIAFTLGLCLLVSIVLGLVPLLRFSSRDLERSLRETSHGRPGQAGQRLRSLLVVAQMALTLILLIAAGLVGKSFYRLLRIDPGFRTESAVAMELNLPRISSTEKEYQDFMQAYRRLLEHGIAPDTPVQFSAEEERQRQFQEQLLDRLGQLPGVSAVGTISLLPLRGDGPDGTFLIDNNPARTGAANFRLASAGYFAAMRIPLLRGRTFDRSDQLNSPPAAVISESMARKYWPNENAIGQTIQFGNMDGDLRLLHVVGVVGDVHDRGVDADASPTVYANSLQRPPSSSLSVVVFGQVAPAALVPAMRAAVHSLDPQLPVNFKTLDQVFSSSLDQHRFSLVIFGAFGAVALLLAAMGIYGVTSYAVAQRTQEIGIRMALGARMGDVLKLILKSGMSLALIGAALGILGAFATTRVMSSLLFGVAPTDVVTFGVVSMTLIAVAFVACFIPARRATKVDPLVALRYE
jgi:putative ABC transport system permease protein